MSNATALAPAKAAKVTEPVNFSWIGIVGILAAFLILAIIALVCLWYKKRAYKQALLDQREFFTASRKTTGSPGHKRKDWPISDEEEESDERSKRGQLILADYESLALGSSHTTSIRGSEDIEYASSRKLSGVLELEALRDKHVVNTGFNWNVGGNLVDEVFYKGEEGSAQMGVRYSRSEFENFKIFTTVGASRKKRAESESASLLRGQSTIAVDSPPTGKWTLRTFSLPVYRHIYTPSSRREVAAPTAEPPRNVNVSESVRPVATSPHSLPVSPVHSFSPDSAFGTRRLTKASSWTQKPSRLGLQATAAFVVPPATPPPPLPLPVSNELQTPLHELRLRVFTVAEPNANCGPFGSPSSLPEDLNSHETQTVSSTPPPPPPPPPPPCPRLPCKRFPPPSPSCSFRTSRETPDAFLPPPALPPGSRSKLAPLILPGRPDLGGLEEFGLGSGGALKMRPLHWEKLKPESRLTMVWDTISDSMELDEDMIENLFGVATRSESESEIAKRRSSNFGARTLEKSGILDPKRAHNIAIQLRARGLSRATVCDALRECDGLGQENLELLVKMAPSDDEVTRFREYNGDLTLLGPADRFVHGILQISSAFERLHAMLFKASYWEEFNQVQETITTLEMACKELKESRTFTKLLETVLKSGNRLNNGTFRGDAKAFKLDTLLKLADVKGVDGKTTLLHFVIREIMKAEGARAARLAAGASSSTSSTPTSSRSTTSSCSTSSPLSHFMEPDVHAGSHCNEFRRAGVDAVRGLPGELFHVRKAGAVDVVALRLSVNKLQSGLQDVNSTLQKLAKEDSRDPRDDGEEADVFRDRMTAFVGEAEAQVQDVQRDLDLVLASVTDVSVYFYGDTDETKSTQPALKVFMVLREFLAMLEQACKDVNVKATAISSGSPSFRLRPAF